MTKYTLCAFCAFMLCANATAQSLPAPQWMKRDILINADIWEKEPKILAAGLGFTNILGIPGMQIPVLSEFLVRIAGGGLERRPRRR